MRKGHVRALGEAHVAGADADADMPSDLKDEVGSEIVPGAKRVVATRCRPVSMGRIELEDLEIAVQAFVQVPGLGLAESPEEPENERRELSLGPFHLQNGFPLDPDSLFRVGIRLPGRTGRPRPGDEPGCQKHRDGHAGETFSDAHGPPPSEFAEQSIAGGAAQVNIRDRE